MQNQKGACIHHHKNHTATLKTQGRSNIKLCIRKTNSLQCGCSRHWRVCASNWHRENIMWFAQCRATNLHIQSSSRN